MTRFACRFETKMTALDNLYKGTKTNCGKDTRSVFTMDLRSEVSSHIKHTGQSIWLNVIAESFACPLLMLQLKNGQVRDFKALSGTLLSENIQYSVDD